MIINSFNTDEEVFVIAEIGNNHEGNFDLACEMIRLAAATGVNAVKFQTFKTELYVHKSQEERRKKLRGFELTFDQFTQLSEVAREEGVLFLSTPFDLESAAFLNSIVPAYKISSGDNNFYPLIEEVAGTGKPIILSSGLANISDLQYATALIRKKWSSAGIASDLAVLHCITNYPVADEDANLWAINDIKDKIDCTVGYSDHTMGIEACLLSVALGARIVEKHFTIDKNYSDFRDHQLSADPEEMKLLVEKIRQAEKMLGSATKKMIAAEEGLEEAVRRSAVLKRNLKAGESVRFSDLAWVRPKGGLAPGDESLVLGKKLKMDMEEGDFITQNDLE